MVRAWLDNQKSKDHWLFIKTILPDVIMLLLMGYALLKFLSPLKTLIDVQLFDERGYLSQGIRLLKDGLPAPADAPLYAIWYFLLSSRQANPIDTYYSNYRFLTILLPLVFYLVLRRYKIPLVPAGVITFFALMISFANLGVWPKISHFTLIVILASFLAASFISSFIHQLALLSLGALLGSFARPELFPVFILLACLCLVNIGLPILKKTPGKLPKAWIASLLVWAAVITTCLVLVGIPTSGQARLDLAFSQHFSLHWIAWNGLALNGFTDYSEVMQQAFGQVLGPFQALASRPDLFFHHFADNFISFWGISIKVFFHHAPILLLSWMQPGETEILFGVTIGFLGYYGLVGLWHLAQDQDHKFSWEVLRAQIQPKRFITRCLSAIEDIKTPLLGSACYLLIAPFSLFVIWPEEHYILLYGVVFILAVSLLAVKRNGTATLKQAVLCGLVLASMTQPAWTLLDRPSVLVNVVTIRFLQSLPVKQKVVMLEADGGYEYYLSYPIQRVRHDTKNQDFDTFLVEQNINTIVMSPLLLKDHRYTNDPEWALFLKNYSQKGFIRLDIPDTNRWVLIQKDILGP